MTTSQPPVTTEERLAGLRRAAPVLLLLLALVVASLLSAGTPGLRLASPDRSRVDQVRQAIGNLPDNALVLIACDADLGTYPEIRAATRVAIDDLAAHGARLAIVSFTPEGRAIAAAERDRISRGGRIEPPADLGYVAGAEAGLVRSIASIVPAGAEGAVAEAIRERGGGIGDCPQDQADEDQGEAEPRGPPADILHAASYELSAPIMSYCAEKR